MFQSIQYLKDHVAGINEVVQNARVYIADSQARIHAQELVENDFLERLTELRAQVTNWRETVAAKQAELDNEIHTQRTTLVGELEAYFEQLNSTKAGLEAEVENLRELKIRRETEYNARIQTSTEELAALEGRVLAAREKLETLRRDIASIMKEN
jgi:chromosome segregation ATPase